MPGVKYGGTLLRTAPFPALGSGIIPLSLLLQLKATDADEGEFGRVWYRILHGKWAERDGRCPSETALPFG